MCVLAVVIGSDVGLSGRVLAAVGVFVACFMIIWLMYWQHGTGPIHGVDLDQRGRPRGDHLYRRRSRDPFCRLLNRDPGLPPPSRTRGIVALGWAAAMSATLSVGTGHQVAAFIVALALPPALYAMAAIVTRRRRKLTTTDHS